MLTEAEERELAEIRLQIGKLGHTCLMAPKYCAKVLEWLDATRAELDLRTAERDDLDRTCGRLLQLVETCRTVAATLREVGFLSGINAAVNRLVEMCRDKSLSPDARYALAVAAETVRKVKVPDAIQSSEAAASPRPTPPHETQELGTPAGHSSEDAAARKAVGDDAVASGDRDLRCVTTGNPCGTDTWTVGSPCPCTPCQQWIESQVLRDRLWHCYGCGAESDMGALCPDVIQCAECGECVMTRQGGAK